MTYEIGTLGIGHGRDEARRLTLQIQDRTRQHADALAAIERNEYLSSEGKKQAREQARKEFEAYHLAARQQALALLERSREEATRRLAGAPSPEDEVRLARAATRVSRLIDGGLSPGEAAAVLAEAGDRDGLRALRDEVPSWVATIATSEGPEQRRRLIHEHTLAVDRARAPLLPAEDRTAVDVLVSIDTETARLDATTEYAFDPTPGGLLKLGYANLPDPPRPGNPAGAHTGQDRVAAAFSSADRAAS